MGSFGRRTILRESSCRSGFLELQLALVHHSMLVDAAKGIVELVDNAEEMGCS